MKAWRMAFRNGSGGEDLWPKCLVRGLAIIAYAGMDFDLSKQRPEAKEAWLELSASQKHSIRTFAYVIRPRDTIYGKSGPQIVGKGVVRSKYHFDQKSLIKDSGGGTWPHTLAVTWKQFDPVSVEIGGPQMPAIRPLSAHDLKKLAIAQTAVGKKPRHLTDPRLMKARC